MKPINLKAIVFVITLTALVLSFNLLVGAQEKPPMPQSGSPMKGDGQQKDKTIQSDKSRQQTQNQTNKTGDHSSQTGAAHSSAQVSNNERQFIMEAAKGGMMEVEMGRLAMERGSSDDVKRFGERLVQDHSKANEELMALASQKGVTIPAHLAMQHDQAKMKDVSSDAKTGSSSTASSSTSKDHTHMDKKHKAMMDRFSALSGENFDREFVREAVRHHEKDVRDFEKQSKNAKDPDVRAFATKNLPTLREHLQTARDLNTRMAGNK